MTLPRFGLFNRIFLAGFLERQALFPFSRELARARVEHGLSWKRSIIQSIRWLLSIGLRLKLIARIYGLALSSLTHIKKEAPSPLQGVEEPFGLIGKSGQVA